MLTICDPDAVDDPNNPVQNCEPMVVATGEAITLADPEVQYGDSIGPSTISAQLSCKSCCLLSPTAGESGMEPAFRNSCVLSSSKVPTVIFIKAALIGFSFTPFEPCLCKENCRLSAFDSLA